MARLIEVFSWCTCICVGFVMSQLKYSKYIKKIEHFSLSILIKMLVIRAETHKILVRKANRVDPDQTASEEAV